MAAQTTPTQTIEWIEYIKAFGPVIVGLAGIYIGYYFNKKMVKSKQIEDERKEIYKKLNDFYGPFQQLRKKSFLLYQIFTSKQPRGFSTLINLLEGKKFEGNDLKILNEIIEIDRTLEKLIVEKSGLVDNSELREILGKAAAHFSIINMAFSGTISGEVERFKDYVFPQELDPKIQAEVLSLKRRLEVLNKL